MGAPWFLLVGLVSACWTSLGAPRRGWHALGDFIVPNPLRRSSGGISVNHHRLTHLADSAFLVLIVLVWCQFSTVGDPATFAGCLQQGSLLVCCWPKFRMSKTCPESLLEPLRPIHQIRLYAAIEVATTCQPLLCYVSITPCCQPFRAIFQRRQTYHMAVVQDGAGRLSNHYRGLPER